MLVHLGFDLPDLNPPICEMGQVHDLQWRLLREAERLMGPRCDGTPVAPATFTDAIHGARTFRNGNELHIELGYLCVRDWACCVLEFAHEIVHVLDGARGGSSVLEEGIACKFGADVAVLMFQDPPLALYSREFETAWHLARPIPYAVIKALRARTPLRAVTVHQLMAAAPGLVTYEQAAALCRPFKSTLAPPARANA